MIVRTLLRAVSCRAAPDPVTVPVPSAVHFAPAAPRPIAFAILEVCGTVNGKTRTVDLDVGDFWDFVPDVGKVPGDRRSRACEVDAGTRESRMVTSVKSKREEGVGSVWDARRTEYCRSHRRKTIS